MRKDYYFGIVVLVIGFLIAGIDYVNLGTGTLVSGLPYGIAIMVLGICIIAYGIKSKPKTLTENKQEVSTP